MNKKLLTQMWNERRSNAVLFLEMVLLSVLLWWVADGFYVRWRAIFMPLGFDISHTYLVALDRFPDTHREYDPLCQEDEWKNMFGILERIRQRPDVEAACMGLNSHPYSEYDNGERVLYDTLSFPAPVTTYRVTPGFFHVFRIHGAYGETPDEMEELLTQEGIMVNRLFLQTENIFVEDWRNKSIRFYYDSTRCGTVLTELNLLRKNEYQTLDYGNRFLLYRFAKEEANSNYTISVRVKAEQDQDFISRFWKDAAKEYRLGNVFVQGVDAFSSVRLQETYYKYYGMYTTIFYCVLFFLLLNTFLALLGTFWFRTRQRRQEIALQMAMGSSRGQVLIRLISEGLVLLVFATFPALLIDYQLFNPRVLESYFNAGMNSLYTPARYFVSVGIAFLMIALTIILGILYPAYYAMKISPAEALNEE